ncbi:MAG TPA: hypothetical protein VH302_05420 [Bryobacteraceae bacterium]|nr:hypothetical protein [Bryobacteraceae bacterium]
MDIMLANGFVPTIGESFTILSSGGLSGAFSNVSWDSFDNGQGYFRVDYDNVDGDVVITAELAPEPATALTLIPALALVFWWARRRGARA